MDDRLVLRLSRNATGKRCTCCGAWAGLYHSALCADQNAMRMEVFDAGLVSPRYDNSDEFADFVARRA